VSWGDLKSERSIICITDALAGVLKSWRPIRKKAIQIDISITASRSMYMIRATSGERRET